MIFAYIRISTDKQTLETQRLEIKKYALKKDLKIDVCLNEIETVTK